LRELAIERADWPRGYLSQEKAAFYLDMSVAKFRRDVKVIPRPAEPPRAGKKPLMRYRIADLDAWMESNASYRIPRR
jgi:hypothetical protein